MIQVPHSSSQSSDTTDEVGLLVKAGVLALVAGAALACSAPAVATVQGGNIPEPQTITIEIPTSMLAYDLAWSMRAEDSHKMIAQRIAAKITDPSVMYIVDLPQLNRHWRAMRWTSNTVDMFGYPLDRKLILQGMYRYEVDVDRGLVAVLRELETLRPGALVAVKNFAPSGDGQYGFVAQECGFMVQAAVPVSTELDFFAGLYEQLLLEGGGVQANQMKQDIQELMVTDSYDAEAFGYGLMIVNPELADWAIWAPIALPDFDLLGQSEWTAEGLVLADQVVDATPAGPDATPDVAPDTPVETFTNDGAPPVDDGSTTTGADDGTTTPTGGDTTTTGGDTTTGGNTSDTSGGSTGDGTDTTADTGGTPTVAGSSDTLDTGGSTTDVVQEPDPAPAPSSKLVYPPRAAKVWPTVTSNGDAMVNGSDTKAIARWGTVPFQVFDSSSDAVSVYAFHRNGIAKVEFYVDGLLSATATETLTGEYSVPLDIASFPDGKHALQAIVYPVHGLTRSLAGAYDVQRTYGGSEWTGEYTLDFFTNAGGSVEVEVVELAAGTYTWGGPTSPIYNGIQQNKDRWLIYRPAPGVRQDQVIINAGLTTFPSGTWYRDIERIKLEGLTINGHAGMLSFFADQGDMLWIDNVVFNGPGMLDPSGAEAAAKHQWWTNTSVSNSRAGMARQFVKGCTFTNIGEDVIREGNFVVDVTIDNVDATGTLWHSGVIGNPIMHDNRIYSNLKMLNIGSSRAWSFRNGTSNHWEHTDVAIINCQAQQTDATTIAMYCGGTIENMLIRNSQFDGSVIWRNGSVTPDQWQFKPNNADSVYITNATHLDGSYLYVPEVFGVERID